MFCTICHANALDKPLSPERATTAGTGKYAIQRRTRTFNKIFLCNMHMMLDLTKGRNAVGATSINKLRKKWVLMHCLDIIIQKDLVLNFETVVGIT